MNATRIVNTRIVLVIVFIAYLAPLLKLIVFKHSSNTAMMGKMSSRLLDYIPPRGYALFV